MQELGFSIHAAPKGKVLSGSELATIHASLPLPVYCPKGLSQLSEEDLFRIGKILEAYQSSPEITETGEGRRKEMGSLVERYMRLLKGEKIPEDKRKLYERILYVSSGAGLGPIDFLLPDPEIEEIMVNGAGIPISVFHRKIGLCLTNLSFDSPEYLIEKANQMLFRLNRRVDESKPTGHGILPNGDRVTVAIPPFSKNPTLDIRKFTAEPMTISDLVESGMLDCRMAAFLFLVMERGGTNVGVIGNTGAGKTTLLNALLRFIPPHERIVSVEEIPEIRILHSQKVGLVEVETLGLKMSDAILETLRLRPDRVVVGEVRTPADALALRDSCLSGQAYGTYYTYHAEDAQFAVERFASQGVGRKDVESFGILVSCKRYEDDRFSTKRVVTEIAEIGKDGKAIPLFAYDFGKGRWTADLDGKTKIEKWLESTYLKGKCLSSELSAREKALGKLSGEPDEAFFGKLWGAKC